MFVRVAIQIPSAKTFTYAVPPGLASAAAVGMRVLVPFGRRRVTGYVLECSPTAACEQEIKEIIDVPDAEPLFGPEDLPFYEWISRYYLHPLGKVLNEVLPGGLTVKSDRWITLTAGASPEPTALSSDRRAITACLARHPQGLSLSRLRRILGRETLAADLKALAAEGCVLMEERLSRAAVRPLRERWVALADPLGDRSLTPKQAALLARLQEQGDRPLRELSAAFKNAGPCLHSLQAKGLVRFYERERSRGPGAVATIGPNGTPLRLTEAQEEALTEIRECLTRGDFCPCLLHGVTGSGKTEVYLRAIAEVLSRGGGVLYLVPEIALTAQLLSRIRDRFPDREIAVLHSGVPLSARYDQWRRIRRGEVRIVVGARSALFAPVQDLKLIIADEEHDPSYKQDDRLRYNARDLALVKGQMARATVLLGSATPALQSAFHARAGRYRYLSLPARIDDRPLPEVEVVDLRVERNEQGLTPLLSRSLREALAKALAQGDQSLLFLNRRGFHTYLFCPDCGHVFGCPNCDIALTHHAGRKVLQCHHCDFAIPGPERCPKCQGGRIRSYGAGTERVEEEIGRLFPQARIARMDSDTTLRKGESARLLGLLDRGEIDILIGTQMIAKGHDFPGITLVGVVAADASLNLPDFRAAERTFQLLTQVAGRGGRGDKPGRVVIQSFNPDHYVIAMARRHDYQGFYAAELPLREQLAYPPFARLIALHCSCLKQEEGKGAVTRLSRRARALAAEQTGGAVEVIGPAASPLARIRGRYRWQLLLKGRESGPLHRLVETLLEKRGKDGLEIQVDVDPVNFM